jgi:phage repressor protein C with HTH and peptisase S24 domain
MDMKGRMLAFIDYLGMKKASFEKKVGLSNGFVDKMGDNTRLSNLEKISNVFPSLNINWLRTGEGEMLKSEAGETIQHVQVEGIPLIPADAMAGIFQGEVQISPAEYEMFVVPAFRNADFLIPVKGDSMQPRYYSGDIVACKMIPLQSIFFQWGKVYVVDTDQGALIKKVEKGSTDETITLVSDNAEYKPFEIPRSCIYHIALVQGVIRAE